MSQTDASWWLPPSLGAGHPGRRSKIIAFFRDLRVAFYSLMRTQGLAITVILTLALGIGANAAIFTLVRGVLLKPLVNRDEDRLIYIRQSAPGIGDENVAFSVPEIQDLRASVKTLIAFGDFSTFGPTMIGLGEPREVQAGVVGGLEPSVPYPQDTEIMANIVTSPHHLSATMVTGRVHRMTELFARLAPGVTLEQARAELRSAYGAMTKAHPEAYSPKADFQIGAKLLRDELPSGARTALLVLLPASALVSLIACSNVANLILTRTVRREGELAIRAAPAASTGALRRMLL